MSGLLFAASFPPFDLGWLALLAPVPLLWTWRDGRARDGALTGLVAGVVFFGIVCNWAANVGFVALVPLVAVMAAWWALAGAVTTTVAGRTAWAGQALWAPFTMAAVWTLIELARSQWPLGGFSWGAVGYAFHRVGAARAIASMAGVELVSFLAVALAGIVVVVAERRPDAERWLAVVPTAVVAAAITAGAALLPSLSTTGSFRVAIAQGNNHNRPPTTQEIIDRFLVNSHLRLAADIHQPVDLIVFPESSIDEDPRDYTDLTAALGDVARNHRSALLVNALTDAPRARLYNTNFWYGSDGVLDGTYSKQHLVPFGEYVPWRDQLSFVHALQQIPTDIVPGRGRRIFPAGRHRIGTMICFESAFAPLARDYARDGADIIVVSTNNRTFGRSANSAQHIAMGQMRAAETGRPVVHAAISGESAIIDGRGRVRSRTRLFQRTLLIGSVTGTRGRTPYDVAGDLPLVTVAAALAGLAAGRVVWGRRRAEP